MKYIKTYEDNFNYKVDIFTVEQAQKFWRKFYKKKNYNYSLLDKIRYYSHSDFHPYIPLAGDEYMKHCRIFIAHNNDDILGMAKFAWWNIQNHFAISYVSTNKDYYQLGVSRRLLETIMKYFSENYPNDILYFSGYSVEGWKYLRKYILEYSKKYNVKIIEQAVKYPGSKGYDKEFYDLYSSSKEEIKKLYDEY